MLITCHWQRKEATETGGTSTDAPLFYIQKSTTIFDTYIYYVV